MSDYSENSIGQWPLFQSCTKDLKIAHYFSKECQKELEGGKYVDRFDGHLLIFEIFLNNQNETATHINMLNDDFTWYQSEEEVLLMPMFTFQVTKVVKETKCRSIDILNTQKKPETFYGHVTTITLV